MAYDSNMVDLIIRVRNMNNDQLLRLAVQQLLSSTDVEEEKCSVTVEAIVDPEGRIVEPFDEKTLLERVNKQPYSHDYRMVVGDDIPTELGLYTFEFIYSDGGVPRHMRQKVWIVPRAD